MNKWEIIMEREQQDIAWACLPKEVRDFIKCQFLAKSDSPDFDGGYNLALIDVCGEHNLTSEAEPEEMLMAKRVDIINRLKTYNTWMGSGVYEAGYIAGKRELLLELFGDKCRPDEEPQETANCEKTEDKQEKELKQPDWEQRRYEIALALFASQHYLSAEESVMNADDLIKALKDVK